jgi:hypothetical protein
MATYSRSFNLRLSPVVNPVVVVRVTTLPPPPTLAEPGVVTQLETVATAEDELPVSPVLNPVVVSRLSLLPPAAR